MATFSLEIADSDIALVTQALCSPIAIGFNMPMADSVDPETARQRAIEFIMEVCHAFQLNQAAASIVPPVIS